MTAEIENAWPARLTALLRRELALEPARMRFIARISVGTAIVTILAMVFQIPLPAYMAYLVFLVSREDVPSTLMSAVGGLLAATVAVAASMLLYVFDAAEPAIRIPLLTFATFAAAYLSRTAKLGPVAFLAGFILVLTQALADTTPDTEALTHGLLWLWVVVAVPAAVAALLALIAGDSSARLIRERAARLMHSLACYIENPASRDLSQLRDELLALEELTNRALRWSKTPKPSARCNRRASVLLLESIQICRRLPSDLPFAARCLLATKLRECRETFLFRGEPVPRGAERQKRDLLTDQESEPACGALHIVLDELSCLVNSPPSDQRADSADDGLAPTALDDAHTRRANARFAFKVACAVLASYLTYTLMDWPGIRTAVTTCFFVSLATIGESLHKLTLRLTGALAGALLAGVCIVFLLPQLTDVGELCLVVVAVSALCAWISTSSETIAYAGMQMAFAFFLGVMQGYGPTSDLTVLRDRVAGIAIGNLWMSIVFTTLWPLGAAQRARQLWALGLEKLSELMLCADDASAGRIRLAIGRYASDADRLQSRSQFERLVARARTVDPTGNNFESITSCVSTIVRLRQPCRAVGPSDAKAAQRLLDLSRCRPCAEACAYAASQSPADRARLQLDEEIDRATRDN